MKIEDIINEQKNIGCDKCTSKDIEFSRTRIKGYDCKSCGFKIIWAPHPSDTGFQKRSDDSGDLRNNEIRCYRCRRFEYHTDYDYMCDRITNESGFKNINNNDDTHNSYDNSPNIGFNPAWGGGV